MKLSARNILKGKVVDITRGAVTSHVRLDIGGMIVTSSITNEAVDELKLKKGVQAYAVIKASGENRRSAMFPPIKLRFHTPYCPLGHSVVGQPTFAPSQ